jgi:hypothetical protein
MKQCGTGNEVHSSQVNNDDIGEGVNVINQKHNVDSLT